MEKKIRIAAFAGTRKGMTELQKSTVQRLLVELEVTHFEHGAAIGADEEASRVARELGLKITARPANIAGERSDVAEADRWVEAAAPLDRNKKLVDFSHFLIATPDGPERPRSGTWTTVNYARSKKKSVWVIMPNGLAALQG